MRPTCPSTPLVEPRGPIRPALPTLLTLAAGAALVAPACDSRPPAQWQFEERVVAVIEARCASAVCHGVAPGAEEAGDVIDRDLFFVDIDDHGRLVDLQAARASSRRAIDTRWPDFSPFLRKPLAVLHGGQPHFGGVDFASPSDPGYRDIRRWITLESDGGAEVPPLDDLEQRFADHVLPALLGMGCLNANCHGQTAAVPYRLDPGIDGVWSDAALRHNYDVSLVMLSLDGDPAQSRLLRKSLPLHDGGIVHKGGNSSFLPDAGDPRAQAIIDWACAERDHRLGAACTASHDTSIAPIAGFVFVRGPAVPHPIMDLDVWSPGTDLWWAPVSGPDLTAGDLVNLTAALHDGADADVRDPAIDPTGERVAFAMRTSEGGGHDLWELELATGEATRLTHDAGPLPGGGIATHRDPAYGPDGTLWFVSTRAGHVADRGHQLDADLYELDPATGALTRRTWTPHTERKPTFYLVGEEAGGEVCFTALRDAVGDDPRAHPFRFPPDLKTEYHQHFGVTPIENVFHDMREMPDGRYTTLVGDLDNAWPAGRLAVVDRNFGPEVPPDAAWHDPGLPFYSAPLVRLDPESLEAGVTQAAYRDPAPLPDGRLLVARAPGPIDLGDPAVVPDFGIEVLTLEEAPDGSGPRIASRQVLVDEPGLSDRDPEPVFLRTPPRTSERQYWDETADTGLIVHNGVPMIEALLANLPPSGPKTPRDDIVGVRIVEALPLTPAERRPIAPDETRDGHAAATTASAGTKGPARVLAEFDLAPDGTFHAELPAGVPFRLQALDAAGMAVGAMHNRWFYVAPGQSLPQGTSHLHTGTYSTRCAGCHGSASGDPEAAFGEPDVITTASLTLSRFEGQNPRRPIPPLQLGDATRMEVDYLDDVQPILDASCATSGCHDATTAAAGVTLTSTPTTWFVDSYETLLAPGDTSRGGSAWVAEQDGSARGSYLIELLTGQELDAPGSLPTSATPHADLSAEELAVLVRWIDLGATFVGHAGGDDE